MIILYHYFLLPLLMTEVIETAAAFILGYRDRSSLLAVVLINLLTNPLANFLYLWGLYLGVKSVSAMLFIIEPLVVLVEWLLLLYVLREGPGRLFSLSLLMNLASFTTGWILLWKGGIGY
jgi:hypothetical protein